MKEIPKYIKKKKKKKVNRADHKHEYKQCLLKLDHNFVIYNWATYCTICGRIGERTAFKVNISEDGKKEVLHSPDIYEKYKDKLEIFDKISDDYKYIRKE